MIISVCGFGSTGSSAASDYLAECANTQNLDQLEFTLITGVDGMEDLEYHLMKHNSRQSASICAIQRFQEKVRGLEHGWIKRTGISREEIENATNEFVDAITQVKYIGLSPRIYKGGSRTVNRYIGNSLMLHRVIKPLERKKIIKKNVDIYPFGEVRLSIKPENFYDEARKYIKRILTGMGADWSKIVVMDQAFSGVDPVRSFPFFEDPYAIIVDRDPRDMFIFAKKVLLSTGRFMPSENVEDFIKYYKLLRDGQPYKEPHERCLFLRFEDMVYNYDVSAAKIDEFLGVENPNRKTIFVPEMSRANTNLIRKFPEFKEDIKKIEAALPEYLFDFDKYPSEDDSGKMFFGKSPLNRRK